MSLNLQPQKMISTFSLSLSPVSPSHGSWIMQELTPFRPPHATPQAFRGKVLRAPWAGALYMGEWAYPRAWKEGICLCTQSYNFIKQVLAFHVHINKTPKILRMGCMSSQIGETSWHGMVVNPEQLYQPSHCPVCFRRRDPWRPMPCSLLTLRIHTSPGPSATCKDG